MFIPSGFCYVAPICIERCETEDCFCGINGPAVVILTSVWELSEVIGDKLIEERFMGERAGSREASLTCLQAVHLATSQTSAGGVSDTKQLSKINSLRKIRAISYSIQPENINLPPPPLMDGPFLSSRQRQCSQIALSSPKNNIRGPSFGLNFCPSMRPASNVSQNDTRDLKLLRPRIPSIVHVVLWESNIQTL